MARTGSEKVLFVKACVYYILIFSQHTHGLSLLWIQVYNYHQSEMFLIDSFAFQRIIPRWQSTDHGSYFQRSIQIPHCQWFRLHKCMYASIYIHFSEGRYSTGQMGVWFVSQRTEERLCLCYSTYEWLLLSGWPSWLGFCPIHRPCVLMCSEARGEEATAGTLLCRPSETVAVPKVHKHIAATARHTRTAPINRKKQDCYQWD